MPGRGSGEGTGGTSCEDVALDGNEATCTAAGDDCAYTAAAEAVAESCEDTDSSGDDCEGFTAGDEASCAPCDYTAGTPAVAEACTGPTSAEGSDQGMPAAVPAPVCRFGRLMEFLALRFDSSFEEKADFSWTAVATSLGDDVAECVEFATEFLAAGQTLPPVAARCSAASECTATAAGTSCDATCDLLGLIQAVNATPSPARPENADWAAGADDVQLLADCADTHARTQEALVERDCGRR